MIQPSPSLSVLIQVVFIFLLDYCDNLMGLSNSTFSHTHLHPSLLLMTFLNYKSHLVITSA